MIDLRKLGSKQGLGPSTKRHKMGSLSFKWQIYVYAGMGTAWRNEVINHCTIALL
jgi:hypothetical protein